MDWTIYAVAGRVIERLLVVLSAGLSVYLGYRLFLQIPDVRDAQGEIKMTSMNMAVKCLGLDLESFSPSLVRQFYSHRT